MYCLAKTPYNYCVFGTVDTVNIFISSNKDLKWEIHYFKNENELIEVIHDLNDNLHVINLLD